MRDSSSASRANEVELRDGQGRSFVVAKKDIDARAKGQVSIMPTGLADTLTDPRLHLDAGLSGIVKIKVNQSSTPKTGWPSLGGRPSGRMVCSRPIDWS